VRAVHGRLRRLTRALPEVLDGDDPKAVHRARVAARRLEEYLAAAFPGPKPKKIKKFRRLVRNVRRDLGGWRNADVVLSLIKKRRRTRKEAPQPWQLVESFTKKERRREIKRARRRLNGLDIEALEDELEKWVEAAEPKSAALQASLGAAAEKWHCALTAAEQSRSAGEMHEFRIATKKLRYRLELVCELRGDAPPLLEALMRLQRALGKWHDIEIADHMIAETLARPKVLLREIPSARMLLDEIEQDNRRQSSAAEDILREARAAASAAEASERPPLLLAFSRP
jgi:CHAD domain-containing protein